MQIIKLPATTPLSHLPSWLKWCLLACCFLVPILFFLQPYAYSANQVKQLYQTALAKGDYKTAYKCLDHRYPGMSYDAFQRWQQQFPGTSSQVTIHKVPFLLHWLYIWRVDLPTNTAIFQLPFPNVTLTIDGISYQANSTHFPVPLFVGTHAVSVQTRGIELEHQTILIGKDPNQPAIAVAIQPSSVLSSTVKTFLMQYNTTWCQAVDLRSPDGILPFLTGRNSSEYQFLTKYIQTVAKQDWVQDLETLKDLQITQIQFADASHVNVTTKEVYHHTLHIVKDHENWKRGDQQQYDSTASWTYRLQLKDPQNLLIESLSRPAQ